MAGPLKTPIEIDQEALATAAEVLGTSTRKEFAATRRPTAGEPGWSSCTRRV